jgi:hypothetical protein
LTGLKTMVVVAATEAGGALRRALLVLAAALIMAAMMVAMAMPAFAAAKEGKANCVGVVASHNAPPGGEVVSAEARALGGLGESASACK